MDYDYKKIDLDRVNTYQKERLTKIFSRLNELKKIKSQEYLDKIIYNLAKDDFRFFVYYFCGQWFFGKEGYLHNYLFDFIESVNQKVIYDEQGIISRPPSSHHNIIAPRGNAKTSLVLFCWTIWDILYRRDKNIVLVADTTETGAKKLNEIKKFLQKPDVIRIYEPVVGNKNIGGKNNNQQLTVNGINITSDSISCSIAGFNLGGDRITRLIFDDMENGEMAKSPAVRQANYNSYFDKIMALNKHNQSISPIVFLINTAKNPDTLCLKLAKENPFYIHLNFKAIWEFPKNMDLWRTWQNILIDDTHRSDLTIEQNRTINQVRADEFYQSNFEKMNEGTVINWAGGQPLESLMREYFRAGTRLFDQEMQGNPYDVSENPFADYVLDEKNNIKNDLYFNISEINYQNMYKIAHLDPATGTKGGDFSALVILGLCKYTRKYYMLDCQLIKSSPEKQLQIITDCLDRWDCSRLLIENAGQQSFIIEWLISYAKEKYVNTNKALEIIKTIPLAKTKAGINKIDAINNVLVNSFAKDKLRFNLNTPQEFFNQLIQFPNCKNDDGLDALASLIFYLTDKN